MARFDEDHEILFGEHNRLDAVAQCANQSTVGSRRDFWVDLSEADDKYSVGGRNLTEHDQELRLLPLHGLDCLGGQTNDDHIVAPIRSVGEFAAPSILAEHSRSAAEVAPRSGSGRCHGSLARTVDTPAPVRGSRSTR